LISYTPKRVKLEWGKFSTVKIFTVGSKSFVTSFQLAGIPGKISEDPQKALQEIKTLTDDSDVGLVLVSDDITESINDELTTLRAEKSTLVFSLPAAGSKKTEVDYRVMLKKILGV
jgi:V/A-type H+-transporting ATPase subunit F